MRYFIIFLMMAFATTSLAQVNVKAGDTVPEDGVFLTKEQVAKIIAETDALKIKHLEELEFEREKALIKLNNQKQLSEAVLNSNIEKYTYLLEVKEKELSGLYKRLEEEQYEHWWFAGGTAIGVVSSVVIYLAVTQVQQLGLSNQ